MARITQASVPIAEIKKKLLPVLQQASIGNYSLNIELEKGDPMNEVYAGIQILINTIREQQADMKTADRRFHEHLTKKYGID